MTSRSPKRRRTTASSSSLTRRRFLSGALALPAAALLTLVGIPGYFALQVAVVMSAIAALAFLAGLTDPRALLRRLDPRG